MSGTRSVTILALLMAPSMAFAQHGAGGAPAPTAPPESRQFDFLIGQWELTVKVPAQGLAQKIHGVPKLAGAWKAWRSFDGFGLEDELSITDAAGNPMALSHNMRIFDRAIHQWIISGLDVYRTKFQSATAEWKDGTMSQSSRGTDQDGKAFLTRTRFYDITPTSFRYQHDRSYDDGKTWEEAALAMTAKRVLATAPR